MPQGTNLVVYVAFCYIIINLPQSQKYIFCLLNAAYKSVHYKIKLLR